MKRISLALVAVFALSGCAGISFAGKGVPMGMLYTSAKGNEKVTENAIGTKTGEACATSILGLVVTGDASVKEAADKGGITKVGVVDQTYSNILGIIANYCVVAHGE